jgi:hypothetical protein
MKCNLEYRKSQVKDAILHEFFAIGEGHEFAGDIFPNQKCSNEDAHDSSVYLLFKPHGSGISQSERNGASRHASLSGSRGKGI